MSHFSRSRTRKFLYQMLYASSYGKIEIESFKESFFSWVFDTQLDDQYLQEMYKIIEENELFLIEIIKKYAPKFDVENMDLSYVLPIFIGASEILFLQEEIPVKVSINESVEIAKVYGDDSSRKMVNGVLNNIYKDLPLLQEQVKTFDKQQFTTIFFKK